VLELVVDSKMKRNVCLPDIDNFLLGIRRNNMGIRFRKRLKIAPGININLSKSGASVSVGKPGATVNFGGKGGTKATVGIPGSGLSYTEQLSKPRRSSAKSEVPAKGKDLGFLGLLAYGMLTLFVFLMLFGLFVD
jgi:hypothetical protein